MKVCKSFKIFSCGFPRFTCKKENRFNIALKNAYLCIDEPALDCLLLSDCDAPFQVHVWNVVSNPAIDPDTPSVERDNFHRKTIRQTHISIFLNSKSSHFVVLLLLLPVLLSESALQLSVRQRNLSAEPPLNEHNNKSDINVKTS
jgi:hypothetical protein